MRFLALPLSLLLAAVVGCSSGDPAPTPEASARTGAVSRSDGSSVTNKTYTGKVPDGFPDDIPLAGPVKTSTYTGVDEAEVFTVTVTAEGSTAEVADQVESALQGEGWTRSDRQESDRGVALVFLKDSGKRNIVVSVTKPDESPGSAVTYNITQ